MADVSCPECDGVLLQRYGKTQAGKQKYRCLDQKCGRQFVVGPVHFIDDKTRALVKGLLSENIPPKKIAAAVPGISLRWIQELKRRLTHD